MSANLPLSRRVARTALLIAAAAPVIGAAGSAHAAALPQAPDLGAVSALDGAVVGDTVDTGTQQATQLVNTAGTVLGKAAADATKGAGKAAGKGTTKGKGSAKGATPAKGAGLLGGLPLKGLPLG
ncbi:MULTISPECIES: ATP-binding protein [unclassified Streptomyces]|uniref:ATP-binding protein n=1 Tax=unclassified Streptomyces TaxID=2593676 RepID=UPI0038038066